MAKRKTPKGYISHTQALTYSTCPLLYKLKYEDGIIPPTNYPMKRGAVMHTALKELNDLAAAEAAGVEDVEGQVGQLAYEDVTRIFKKAVRAETKPGEIEPRDMQEMMVSLQRSAERIYRTTGTMIEAECEVQVEFKRGLNLLVIIDRIDTWEENGAELTDYKYAFKILSKKDLLRDPQLNIYCYAYSIINPHLERFKLTQDMLRYGFKNSVEVNREDVAHIREYLEHVIEGIEAKDYEPRINDWCHSCLRRVQCPAYKDRYVVNKEDLADVEKAHAEWVDLEAKKALIQNRREQVRLFMAGKVEKHGRIPVEEGLREWYYWETEGKERNAKATVELFMQNGLDITPLLTVSSAVYNESRNQLFARLPQSKITKFLEAEKGLVKRKVTTRLAPRKVK